MGKVKMIGALVVIGIIGGLSWWLTREPDFEYRQKWWKSAWPPVSLMKARLDSVKMAKYVFGDSLMTVPYPDFFKVQERGEDDPDDPNVCFVHTTDSGMIYLRAIVSANKDHWSTEQWADTLVWLGQECYGDSIMMKDMHPGYFYLKGEHNEEYGGGRFYQQYIVEEDTCYVFSVFYSRIFKDEDVKRLIQLIHDWNPK